MGRRTLYLRGSRRLATLGVAAFAGSLLSVTAPPAQAVPVAAPVAAPAAAAAEPVTTYGPADSCQVYVVPDQVGQVDVQLVGGAGFAGGGPGSPGGRGGVVTARLDVEPGEHLYAVVPSAAGGTGREQVGGGARHRGGAGGDSHKGFGMWDAIDYGGGGGGASWLSTDNATCGSSGVAVNGDAVLAVAGGGGGGGSKAPGGNGGPGGDAGSPGGASRHCYPIFGGCSTGSNGGGAGGLHGGGSGGASGAGGGTYIGWAPTGGGAGALYRNGGSVSSGDQFGGGGGGGWFGGGQGGSFLDTYGGGGGGSSYVVPGRTSAGTTPSLAVNTAGYTPFLSITPVASRRLTVATDGSGSGRVTSGDGRVDCGTGVTTCVATVDAGAPLTLTAVPGANQRFAGWRGGTCSGLELTCAVTMDQRRSVTATFHQLRRLTWSTDGSGGGEITTSPAGFPCGTGCIDVDQGTAVTLHQAPDASSVFRGWDDGRGSCPGLGSCTITLTDRAVHVEATYRRSVLTVSTRGAGAGTVTGTVDGEPCATADCSGRHPYGTEVVLTHHAAVGSTGQWWSHPCAETADSCTITMDGSRAVVASFTRSTRRLDVVKDGTGGGLITSDTPGIACGDGCVERWFALEQLSTVTLRAAGLTGTPSYDSTFTGWSGACSGTGDCTVSLDQARAVRATFTLVPRHRITVPGSEGSGRGTITTDLPGLDCAASCQAEVYDGTQVTLTATPSATSTLAGWTGACAGSGTTCTLTMYQARTVSPIFTLQRHRLTLARTGTGAGTVTSGLIQVGPFPEDITLDCGTVCTGDLPHGASVLVEADPAANARFTGWSGACTGTEQCRVTMDRARSVTAEFTRDVRRLQVATTGAGGGVVTGGLAGVDGTVIDCGDVCAADYDRSTTVSVTAVPRAADSRFVRWTGACETTAAVCTVQLAEAASATAHFELNTVRVATTGGGSGTVTSAPSGLDCGAVCAATYADGASVVLTATPDADSTFTGWSAPCANAGTGTCTVVAGGERSVTAAFTTTPSVAVTVAGTGADRGSVFDGIEGGISCGAQGTGACTRDLLPGQSVRLNAHAGFNSSVRFDHWEGACSGTSIACTLTPDDAVAARAVFTRHTRPVTVTLSGTGGGAVASTPAGLTCAGAVCETEVGIDEDLTLSATPDEDSTFGGWTGDCAGPDLCRLPATRDVDYSGVPLEVTAAFTALPKPTLTVEPRGDGRGSVTSDVGGIDCAVGDTCAAALRSGTLVWLTAHSGATTVFDGWAGDACLSAAGDRCQVRLDQAMTARATFRLQTGLVHVGKDAYDTGDGTVTSSPSGLTDCLDCEAGFEVGTTVTLTADPAATSTFTRWSQGSCANPDADRTARCEVLVGFAATVVQATFTHHRISLSASADGGSGTGFVRVGTTPAFDCAGTCAAYFPYRADDNVTLTPRADTGMQFVRWATCSGQVAAGSCYVSMFEQDHEAVAVFEPIQRTLTTVVQGVGTGAAAAKGAVTVPATGATCASGSCPFTFQQGERATVVAAPGPNTVFDSWSAGACSGQGAVCTLTMSAATTVTARFRGAARSVTIVNDGGGSTSSTLNPLRCSVATCTANLDHGTAAGIAANPAPYHHFVRWEGACAGQGRSCSVTVDGDETLTAVYRHDPYALDVARAGTGAGAVTSDVGGIACGETCSALVGAGEPVTLTATPADGSTFVGWEGACTGSSTACTLTMDDARSTTATFDLVARHLEVERLGAGSGTVVSDPAGIDCGTACATDLAGGSTVTLTAAADAGSTFAGWGGACADVAGSTCTVTMDDARRVTATFDPLPRHALTVTRAGSGTGSVSSDPGGIDCGTTCAQTLPSDAVVTLTATPAAGSVFTGWSGAGCSGTEPCRLELTEARSVTATFTVVAQASTTALSLSPTARAYGRASTAVVTVTGASAPTGRVELRDGARLLATADLVAGTARFPLASTLAVGPHALTATYLGSERLTGSASPARTLTVTKAPVTLTGKLAAARIKAKARGSVKVSAVAVGVVPSGVVVVKEGAKILGKGTLRNGVVTVALPRLAKGAHRLVVTYAGSPTVAAAVTKPLVLKVV
ncbi:InlB B-repeat-containing protein [Nocardioides lijunqiniae]|uniref:InlB B-repeat-containing protein n=1 Tax=Nocardioides lijunqiniae TaxID=2760832 RepID=UPI0018788F4C|nr:Ig-like domain repeat protein [Nocardioides lijunqiniae]